MQMTLSCCSCFSQRGFSKVDFLWSVTLNSPVLDIHETILSSALTRLCSFLVNPNLCFYISEHLKNSFPLSD